MNKANKLVAVFCLTAALAITALGGDIQSPPCTPGDVNTPPCSAAQPTTDDSTNLQEIQSLPAGETIAISTIAEAAVGAILSVF